MTRCPLPYDQYSPMLAAELWMGKRPKQLDKSLLPPTLAPMCECPRCPLATVCLISIPLPRHSYLIHGLSEDETLSITLDFRAADPASEPCRNLVLSEQLNRLLDDLRGEAGAPAPPSAISDYLREADSPLLSLSMAPDQSHFFHTNPNGMCGYILVYQLHQRATSSPVESYSPTPLDLRSAAERDRLSAFLQRLSRPMDDCSAAVAGVRSWMSDEYRDTSTSPFLPRSSDLWFRLRWFQLLTGVIPFALFLFDCLEEEFPGGPPSPTSFGPLTWSGARGAQRRSTFADLTTICSQGNFAALSSSHFHLLPYQPPHSLLQKLAEALSALSRQLHATLLMCPTIRVRWAPSEVVDLDSSDPPHAKGSTPGPVSSPVPPHRPLPPGGAVSLLTISPPSLPHKRSSSPLLYEDFQARSMPPTARRTRSRRSNSDPASQQETRSPETTFRPCDTPKRQRQFTLTDFWRRQAPPEVDIPPMILHSPPDDADRVSSPPPKRGRVGPDGVVRSGIG